MSEAFEFFLAYSFYLWLGLLVILIIMAIWIGILHWRLSRALRHYRILTQGAESGNLPTVLEQQALQLRQVTSRTVALEDDYRRLATTLERAIQRVGVVRFNPFQDVGGNQSFAVALLDAKGNGLVLTGLYGRTEQRLYAKPLQAYRSPFPLSAEEQEAIRQAAQGDG